MQFCHHKPSIPTTATSVKQQSHVLVWGFGCGVFVHLQLEERSEHAAASESPPRPRDSDDGSGCSSSSDSSGSASSDDSGSACDAVIAHGASASDSLSNTGPEGAGSVGSGVGAGAGAGASAGDGANGAVAASVDALLREQRGVAFPFWDAYGAAPAPFPLVTQVAHRLVGCQHCRTGNVFMHSCGRVRVRLRAYGAVWSMLHRRCVWLVVVPHSKSPPCTYRWRIAGIQEAVFWGGRHGDNCFTGFPSTVGSQGFVVAGSDDGRFLIWDVRTTGVGGEETSLCPPSCSLRHSSTTC